VNLRYIVKKTLIVIHQGGCTTGGKNWSEDLWENQVKNGGIARSKRRAKKNLYEGNGEKSEW